MYGMLFLSDLSHIYLYIFLTGFSKTSKYKFSEKSSTGDQVVPCGQTDRHTDIHDEGNSCFPKLCEHA